MASVAILGTGLIGASLGIGLAGRGWVVRGWDPSEAALEKAVAMGAVTHPVGSGDEAVDGADLVVLAGPVAAIIETLRSLHTEAIVTDVAGVKVPVVAAAGHLPRFVGGHPMAGRETSGPEGASGSMFHGATWVVTPDGTDEETVTAVEQMIRSVGAVPVRMSARAHDEAVAACSHLPHLTAAALVGSVVENGDALRLAAGGFRDLTRIAMSDPGWWVDVLITNREPVVRAVRSLIDRLETLGAIVAEGDAEGLEKVLGEARTARLGMTAPVATVGVLLEDRPGEIARVGHALAESGVDLRDLQLRHATHGGGGVLTLSVRAAELERLRRALRAEGFRLVETR